MTTALHEVLEAEKKAEEAVIAAKEKVQSALVTAHKDRNLQLEEERIRLDKTEAEELAKHKEVVNQKVEEIEQQTKTRISAIEQRFKEKKTVIVEQITKNLK